jgi:WS/DGAT C-terminal domain
VVQPEPAVSVVVVGLHLAGVVVGVVVLVVVDLVAVLVGVVVDVGDAVLFPVPPIAMNLRTSVAMLSYADDLFFGILGDYETVPDVDALARDVEFAVARLAACSKRRRTAPDRRGLVLVGSA